jgi:hypothetical protein
MKWGESRIFRKKLWDFFSGGKNSVFKQEGIPGWKGMALFDDPYHQ